MPFKMTQQRVFTYTSEGVGVQVAYTAQESFCAVTKKGWKETAWTPEELKGCVTVFLSFRQL